MILDIKKAMAVLDATKLEIIDDHVNSKGWPQPEKDAMFAKLLDAFSTVQSELQRQLDHAIDGHCEMEV
jgi:hypothetical protein|tara:strand:+ start:666 stop:872 length:207 start_codon:yes stop_codon:yes gene_type:complete